MAVYLDDLKHALGFSQEQINLVGASAYVGSQCLNVFVGILLRKFNKPILFTVIYSFFALVGFAGIFLCLLFHVNSFLLVLFSMIIASLGMIALLVTVTPLLLSHCRTQQGAELYMSVVIDIFGVVGAAAAGVYWVIPWSSRAKLELFMAYHGMSSFGMGILVAVFLSISLSRREKKSQNLQNTQISKEDEDDTPSVEKGVNESENECENDPLISPREPSVETICGFLGRSTIWAHHLTWLIVFGVSVNFYNNSGTIMDSLDSSYDMKFLVLLLFGIGQTVGRIFYGYVIRKNFCGTGNMQVGLSVLFMSSVLLSLTSLSAAWHNTEHTMLVYISIMSICYGGLWSLFSMIGFQWQKTYFPFSSIRPEIVYGIMCYGPGLGPLMFDGLSGVLYDQKADSDHNCSGQDCYRLYFLISGLLSVFISIFVFLWRTRKSVRG
eukprot:TRINITY_DN30934_c0_g1_i1.p1 TRINITY_DN30934_c0_g1~~TRINITY_DN30934_c0_g1_i1.p1  ORF type:complete len:498 (-),score=93.39 TRINITY_DN30934_c0_g1_i1:174-1487(-)